MFVRSIQHQEATILDGDAESNAGMSETGNDQSVSANLGDNNAMVKDHGIRQYQDNLIQKVVILTGDPHSLPESFNHSKHTGTICLPEGSYELNLYNSMCDGCLQSSSSVEYGLYFNGGRPVRPTSSANFTDGLEVTQFVVTFFDIIAAASSASPSLSKAPSAFTLSPSVFPSFETNDIVSNILALQFYRN